MELENFKRWHWAVLGVVGGLLLGLTYRFMYPGYDPALPTMTHAAGLETLATARDFETGEPIVRNLTVYPPSKPTSETHLVTFELREVYRLSRPTPLGDVTWTEARWTPYKSRIEIPYNPTGPEGNTFADRLRELEASGLAADLEWREAWWQNPGQGVALYTVAGLLLVGGVWPTTLNLMTGMGLARPPERKAERRPVFSEPEEAPSFAGRRHATAEEMEELALLNADLVSRVGTGFGPDTGGGGAVPAQTAAAPRKLVADKAPKPRPATPKESKEFVEGGYYPVARPGKKRDD